MSSALPPIVLLDTVQKAIAATYLSEVIPCGNCRIVKVEVSGVSFVAGTAPTVLLQVEDMIAGGSVGGGYLSPASGLASGELGNVYLGEGLPTTSVTTNLSGVKYALAFARMTHVQVQCGLGGSPTSATFRVRVIGFP